VLSSELGREWALLVGIVHSPLRLEAIQDTAVEEGVNKLRLDELNYGKCDT